MEKLSIAEKAIIIAIVIIIAIWIIYRLAKTGYLPTGIFKGITEKMYKSKDFFDRQYDSFFTGPVALYEKTTGHLNDDIAGMALKKSKKRERLHSYNEELGKLSLSNIAEATVTAFILGDLYQYNVAGSTTNPDQQEAALHNAAYYYGRALDRISMYPRTLVAVNPDTNPQIEHIIDRVETFNAGRNRAQNTQPLRATVRKARRDTAKRDYFKPRPVQNDPQNVHDSGVVDTLGEKYRTIKKYIDYNGTLDEISDAIAKSSLSKSRKSDAKRVFDIMTNTNSKLSSMDDREANVLLTVWNRINSTVNADNKDNLQEAFIDALADSVESRGLVCATGRCSRIIESLTLLDKSPEIAEPVKTTDILRNEALTKAYTVLQDELSSADTDIADAYNGKGNPDEELKVRVEQFEENTRQAIATALRKDYPNVKESILTNIINDAQAGV